jgi:hypothetical protein
MTVTTHSDSMADSSSWTSWIKMHSPFERVCFSVKNFHAAHPVILGHNWLDRSRDNLLAIGCCFNSGRLTVASGKPTSWSSKIDCKFLVHVKLVRYCSPPPTHTPHTPSFFCFICIRVQLSVLSWLVSDTSPYHVFRLPLEPPC